MIVGKALLSAFFLFLCTSFSSCAFGAEDSTSSNGADPEDTDVLVLTKDNFHTVTEDNKLVLVEFYAPWCGHCKRLAPEYEKAATILKEDGVLLGKVDATEEEELSQNFGVRGYPTLKFFRNGKAEEYKGGRTSDGIVSWVRRMSGPAVETVDTFDKAEEVASSVEVAFIGVFKDAESAAGKTFGEIADANRLLGKFILVISSDASDEVFVRRGTEKTDVKIAITESNREDVEKFVAVERFPYFGPISGDNYGDYFSSDSELVWVAGEKSDYEKLGEAVRTAAKELRPKNTFVWLDTEKFADHATQALGVKEFPAVVLQTKSARYVFPEENVKADELIKFVHDVEEGKIEKSLMSEPIPETNDEAVTVVVGKNFESIVMDADKDVLLEVYATWCGHCKKFEPTYKETAEQLIPHNKHLVIAKMDGTANESPVDTFQWRGFPTIFWHKAGADKAERSPVLYEGPRSMEGIIDFLKENSSKDLVTADAAEAKDEL